MIKKKKRFCAAIVFFFLTACNGASNHTTLNYPPCTIITQENRILSAAYHSTDCFDLYLKPSKKLGAVCTSSDPKLLETMGIVTADEAAPSFDFRGKTFVVTGASQYQMERFFSTDEVEVKIATVDCDTINGSIYRSTSTCFVATAPVRAKKFLYAYFVSEFHTEKERGISKGCAKAILNDVLRR